MYPLLSSRYAYGSLSIALDESINHHDDNVIKRKVSLDEGFDRFTFIINFIRNVYNIFLMYYYWSKGYGIGIGQALLMIYCLIGIFTDIVGCMLACDIVASKVSGIWAELAFYVLISLVHLFQPLFIAFLYIVHLKQSQREALYTTIFTNLLFNGVGAAIVLFYYLVLHPAQLFIPSQSDQLIMVIYLILFALSIVSVHPLFMPLNSINIKHLLFKLCAVLLNVIRTLFVGFLLTSYHWSNISVHPTVEYIYDCYI